MINSIKNIFKKEKIKLHIMCIDDSRAILKAITYVVKDICEENNIEYIFETYENYKSFLKHRENRYDIAIIDWNLPDAKGRDIVKQLNGDTRYKIIYTGMSDDNLEISNFCFKNNITYIPKGSSVQINEEVININNFIEKIIKKLSHELL